MIMKLDKQILLLFFLFKAHLHVLRNIANIKEQAEFSFQILLR